MVKVEGGRPGSRTGDANAIDLSARWPRFR